MTDEQIIKALEICTSEHLGCEDGCPRRHNGLTYAKCRLGFMKDALDLIKRQKAEIDRLKNLNKSFADIGKFYSEIKIEIIKEFWEKAKEKQKWDVDIPNYVIVADGDNLLKEMEQSVNYESTKLERK